MVGTVQSVKPIIRRIDKGRSRYYEVEGDPRVDGLKLPSVTAILGVIGKPALIPWARNMALEKARATLLDNLGIALDSEEQIDELIEKARKRPDEVRDQAADFGTRAHILIEEYLRGKEPEVPDDLADVFSGFLSWQGDAGLEIQYTEQMVYSATYKYAGSMDAVAKRGDQLVALDWKTSSGIYPEMALQVAAYAAAWEEMNAQSVHEAWVVRFGKKQPEFEARQVKNLDAAFQGFIAAQTLKSLLGLNVWEVA